MENQPQQNEELADVATPIEEPKSKPVARHIRRSERSKAVPLDWPVEFDGKEYEEITIRRANGDELAHYIGEIASGAENIHPPFIDCPPEVYEILDDDDLSRIDEELQPFLSKRFLAVMNSTPEASNKSSAK